MNLPRLSEETEEARRASRGAERIPVLNRSRNRGPKTLCHTAEKPINGLAKAAKK